MRIRLKYSLRVLFFIVAIAAIVALLLHPQTTYESFHNKLGKSLEKLVSNEDKLSLLNRYFQVGETFSDVWNNPLIPHASVWGTADYPLVTVCAWTSLSNPKYRFWTHRYSGLILAFDAESEKLTAIGLAELDKDGEIYFDHKTLSWIVRPNDAELDRNVAQTQL